MKTEKNSSPRNSDKVFNDIVKAVGEIKYGSIQIHIQDGKIIQIDKISKVRMH